jgi:hypothetical protein
VPHERERSLWLDLHICVQQGMTVRSGLGGSRVTTMMAMSFSNKNTSRLFQIKDIIIVFVQIKEHGNVVASEAHLAGGLEDSEDVCGAGLIGPPEASVSCTMGITSITASRGGRQGP